MDLNQPLCLGIPIPHKVRRLITRRQATSEEHPDPELFPIISEFGQMHGISSKEIEKAGELAKGHRDLVILLTRPAQDHDYEASFEHFVQNSPVLSSIDDLRPPSWHPERRRVDYRRSVKA